MNEKQTNQVREAIELTMAHTGWTFEPGHNPNVRHVHMTLEPLHTLHRPLLLYILVGIKNSLCNFFLLAMGYQRHVLNGISYWYRPAITAERHLPTVFFHGITTGWAPYVLLVNHLKDHRAVFLIDLDAIKIHSLCFDMPTPEDFCATVKSILDKHNTSRVNIVGHSFGTITSGWFVRAYPRYVAHMSLIDPVSLLLSYPDVAYNFLYRSPSTVMQWLLYLAAASELTVATALRRNFWWYRNELWLEDVHPAIGVHVSLAGKDEICHSPLVQEYLVQAIADREKVASERLRGITHAECEYSCDVNDNGTIHLQNHRREACVCGKCRVSKITYCYRANDSHAQVLLSDGCLRKLAIEILLGQHSSTKAE